MVRRKGTSRVSGAGSAEQSAAGPVPRSSSLPSLRQRRPVMYWVVVLAVVAMVLSTIASFVSAFV